MCRPKSDVPGDAVSRGARIVCVADAFDAMTSERPYRRPRGRDAALAELRRCSGTQFDAACVEALADVLERTDRDPAESARLIGSSDADGAGEGGKSRKNPNLTVLDSDKRASVRA